MNHNNKYDIAIIGGGLAGLALSIQSAKAGYTVVVFEKEKYPFHRVCGEYISLESHDFLKRIGMPLDSFQLPAIKKLLLTAPNGKMLEQELPLGGFGISRYLLDSTLAAIAKKCGVTIYENTRVEEVKLRDDDFGIYSSIPEIRSRIAAGCFGKRSNLDVKWKRDFVQKKNKRLNNYIGVKYHVKTDFPGDTIALHNFKNGYCGISRIEDGQYCLCYLTTAGNLQEAGGSIKKMEESFLYKNPHLRKIFTQAEFLCEEPVTIAQVSFSKKMLVEDHILMTGDAAGMITPLCGNGMSMALHSSKLSFDEIDKYLQGKINRVEMENNYKANWNRQFARRLAAGRIIQSFFGSPVLSNLLISITKPLPWLARKIISATHGKPF